MDGGDTCSRCPAGFYCNAIAMIEPKICPMVSQKRWSVGTRYPDSILIFRGIRNLLCFTGVLLCQWQLPAWTLSGRHLWKQKRVDSLSRLQPMHSRILLCFPWTENPKWEMWGWLLLPEQSSDPGKSQTFPVLESSIGQYSDGCPRNYGIVSC